MFRHRRVLECLDCFPKIQFERWQPKVLVSVGQLSDRLRNFRKLCVNGTALQPQLIINSGISTDRCAWRYIVWDTALSGGNRSIADRAMAGDADLPGKDHVVSYFGRTRQS